MITTGTMFNPLEFQMEIKFSQVSTLQVCFIIIKIVYLVMMKFFLILFIAFWLPYAYLWVQTSVWDRNSTVCEFA